MAADVSLVMAADVSLVMGDRSFRAATSARSKASSSGVEGTRPARFIRESNENPTGRKRMPMFSSFDGVKLNYETEGEGSPVVLLHGFAASTRTNWVEPGIWSALVEAGHWVIGLDARGHGESEKPHEPDSYADGAMVRDVAALFDHLALSEASVAGYSMGAGTALRFAMTDRRVQRLVLGGIGGDMARRVSGQGSEEWEQRSKRIAAALEAEDPSSVEDPTARGFRRFADRQGADRLALAAIQRSHRFAGAAGDVASVKGPALVIAGDADVDPRPLADQLPAARFAVVSGDHLSAVGDPAFAAAIVEFLAEDR
jgi:pimeloyl-ACP methyl ester carboxylesterase